MSHGLPMSHDVPMDRMELLEVICMFDLQLSRVSERHIALPPPPSYDLYKI